MLKIVDGRVDESKHAGQILVDALLLIEVVDDRRVLASKRFEALFPAGIREAAAVEDKPAAVAGLVLGQLVMKRKAENADNEIVGFESDALEFFRSEHALKRAEKRGQCDGQLHVVEQPADVFQGVGDALQEMHFAFEKAAIAVGAKCLHDADVNEAVVVAQEGFAVEVDEGRERIEIVIEKPLAKIGREVGLGVEEKRGDVVLQGAFAAALIVNEIGQAAAQHDVARLKIAIEEIIGRGPKEEIGEAVEIGFQGAFVKGNAGEPQKIVFAVVQVPGDGLPIEAGNGITEAVVEVARGFDLEAREDADGFAVGIDNGGSDIVAGAIPGEKFEQRGVAEIFL